MRSRAWRRAQESIKRLKARDVVKSRFLDENREPTPADIGKAASVHCRDCSCWMCGNPRKFFKQKSLNEKALESIGDILSDNA
jgi:hypothetical protein